MKNNFTPVRLICLGGLFATLASAQTNYVIQAPAEPTKNHFGLAYRSALNIHVHFKKFGGFNPFSNGGPGPGPATGGGIDRTYDDGYNRRDVRGNALGLTWNWGYDGAGQNVGDTLVMHSYSASADASSKSVNGDPQHGFELTYNRRIDQFRSGWWGLEAGFGITDLTFKDNHPLYASVTQITDTYVLNGVVPPLPPYHGTFTNSGPLISDSPSSRNTQITVNGATVLGQRNFDANVENFRFGPYLEFPGKKLSFALSGGFACAIIDSDFSYTETVIITGVGSSTTSGHGSRADFLPGGYVAGQISYKLNDRLDVFGGVQYQVLGKYNQFVSGKRAELDLSESLFVTIGLGISFK